MLLLPEKSVEPSAQSRSRRPLMAYAASVAVAVAVVGAVSPVSPVAAAPARVPQLPRVVNCALVPSSMVATYLKVAAGPARQSTVMGTEIRCWYKVASNPLAVQVVFAKGPYSLFRQKELAYQKGGAGTAAGPWKAAFFDSSANRGTMAYSTLLLWAKGYEVDFTAQGVTLGQVEALAKIVVSVL